MSDRSKYGYEHKKLRKQWKVLVDTGTVNCARCGKPIEPGALWDLDHVDGSETEYLGPSCRGCNRATLTHAKESRQTTGYDWF